ncbi:MULTISPECIES: BCCT family transporter [unclassified Pseudoalteromonas]|uniref:BCCT family transporter n=1 Tax=Pseudoalteromonas TaxID=53246 RepID=UPI001EFCD029|nr:MULTISPECIES: BCCT family transporter [unclassified Pseudoalteromonas]MCG9708963.1 BCCT family transporter [Pseudoalteromonas sp. Isolate3]
MKHTTSSLEKTALALCMLGALIAVILPSFITEQVQPFVQTVLDWIGSSFFLMVNFLLFAIIILAISPLGSRKVGGQDAVVEYSNFGWFAMLFAAGMGSGLVFWGVAEPALHSLDPPLKQSLYPDRLASSLALTLVNWGAHAWALYAVFALVLGGLTQYSGKSGDICSPVLTAVGNRFDKSTKFTVSFIVKLIAVLAIFFGVVGTIANSTLLISKGVEIELGVTSTLLVGSLIVCLLTVIYSLSVKFGLRRGVQSLSIFNVILAFSLLVWLLTVVPIEPIIKIALDGTGYYLQLLVTGTWQFDSQLKAPDWATHWTYNYYFWWLAWGPFVGVFLAKISQGRKVWQFIFAVVCIPTLVTIIWFATFSGAAIEWDRLNQAGILVAIKQDYSQGLFVFFNQLGWQGTVFIWASLLLLLIFVATSADSAILVIRELVGADPSNRVTLYTWCLALFLCSLALLLLQDEPLNRSVAILGALPFLLIFLLQLVGFLKEFIRDICD